MYYIINVMYISVTGLNTKHFMSIRYTHTTERLTKSSQNIKQFAIRLYNIQCTYHKPQTHKTKKTHR